MSIYQIALAVFLIVVGLMYLFGLDRVWEVVAGVAALVAGVLLLLEGNGLVVKR